MPICEFCNGSGEPCEHCGGVGKVGTRRMTIEEWERLRKQKLRLERLQKRHSTETTQLLQDAAGELDKLESLEFNVVQLKALAAKLTTDEVVLEMAIEQVEACDMARLIKYFAQHIKSQMTSKEIAEFKTLPFPFSHLLYQSSDELEQNT